MDRDADFLRGWLDGGNAEQLHYMHRNIDRRCDPRGLFEGAQSVVVCAVNYRNPLSAGYPEGFGGARVASYALCVDYHTTIKRMLQQMAERLRAIYPTLTGRCFVDTAPLMEKALAVRAGLGAVGRNSLLLTPQYGSFVLLGELVLADEIDHYDAPLDWSPCGECHLCERLCPVGAINPNRTIDTRRCISAVTLEVGGSADTHGWVCGCDECQTRCPHNHGKPLSDNPAFMPIIDPLKPEVERLLSARELAPEFATTPLARAFRRRE